MYNVNGFEKLHLTKLFNTVIPVVPKLNRKLWRSSKQSKSG